MKKNFKIDLTGVRTRIYTEKGVSSITRSVERMGVETQDVVRGVTPNWPVRKKIMPLPINPYSISYTRQIFGVGHISYTSVSGQSVLTTGNVSNTAHVPNTSTSIVQGNLTAIDAMDRRAVIALRNKMKDMKVSVSQFYAERAQTLNLLTETANKMAQAILALRRYDYVEAANHLGLAARRKSRPYKRLKRAEWYPNWRKQEKAVADAWLQLGFGWMPLIQDARGAAEALAKHNNQFFFGRVTHSEEGSFSEEIISPIAGYTATNTQFNKTHIKIKYVLLFQQDLRVSASLSSLGLTNPAAVGWEMLPWSFAIDYIIPIGNWISQLDASVGLTFAAGSKSVTTKINNVAIRAGFYQDTQSRTEFVTRGSYKKETFQRSPLFSFPLALVPEGLNPDMSVKRWINAAALLSQARHSVPSYRRQADNVW